MPSELVGHDVYLRFDSGPVQCFRVWDVELFFARINRDNRKDERLITFATESDYRSEHRRTGSA